MKPSEIRKELHTYLDNADDESLSYVREAVIAYQIKKIKEDDKFHSDSKNYPWSPTDDALCTAVEQAEENLKNGKFYTEAEMDSFITKLIANV